MLHREWLLKQSPGLYPQQKIDNTYTLPKSNQNANNNTFIKRLQMEYRRSIAPFFLYKDIFT